MNDEGYRAFLVDTFLNAVYLYDDDKLVLVLNYTGERCKVTLELVEAAVEGDPGGSCFAPSGAPKAKGTQEGAFCFGQAGRARTHSMGISVGFPSVFVFISSSIFCTLTPRPNTS